MIWWWGDGAMGQWGVASTKKIVSLQCYWIPGFVRKEFILPIWKLWISSSDKLNFLCLRTIVHDPYDGLLKSRFNACRDLNEIVIHSFFNFFFFLVFHIALSAHYTSQCHFNSNAQIHLSTLPTETLNRELLIMATNDFESSLVSLDRTFSRKYCPLVVSSILMKSVSNCYLLRLSMFGQCCRIYSMAIHVTYRQFIQHILIYKRSTI